MGCAVFPHSGLESFSFECGWEVKWDLGCGHRDSGWVESWSGRGLFCNIPIFLPPFGHMYLVWALAFLTVAMTVMHPTSIISISLLLSAGTISCRLTQQRMSHRRRAKVPRSVLTSYRLRQLSELV
ncbi:hypothetical protein BC936DRAFT_144695 [Jimgerdemannia flammicorona]|uniref:Uncharacterized protein n=1 Tax=Jimgerdemannia flammicorona TaxID=994334 RepID=A0A433DBZ1_9FUNG|nr:hypothetical protein BC936DRAFT_144695 [Jimgerdemannia flammicorona]